MCYEMMTLPGIMVNPIDEGMVLELVPVSTLMEKLDALDFEIKLVQIF